MELSFKQGKRVQLTQDVMNETINTLKQALKAGLSINSVHFCPSLISNTLYDVHVDILTKDERPAGGSVFYLVPGEAGSLRLDLTNCSLLYPFFEFAG